MLALIAVFGVHSAWAGNAKVGAIDITDAWARATPAHAMTGGAFATITNTGSEDDQLVSAASDVAKVVELHTHVMEGEVMRMRRVPAIDIPAGKTVALAPGSFHIMLIGLQRPLQEGETFPLTLVFKHAGTVTVSVDVKGMGAMGSGAPMMRGHGPSTP